MSYLAINNLSLSFGDKVLFNKLSMTVQKGQKIALLARNGSGKSTLLSVIMGAAIYHEGDVVLNAGIRTSILTQSHALDLTKSVRDILVNDAILQRNFDAGIWDYEAQAETMCRELELWSVRDQIVGTLSGGEQKRLQLIQVLLEYPDFLILDEPTNHLDLGMIYWLEQYLIDSQLTILLITHDRYFLERVCTHIYELDNGIITIYSGNYSYYIENKLEREKIAASTLHKMKQLYKKELTWMKTAPRARSTKSQSRQNAFYDLTSDLSHQKERVQYLQNKLKLHDIDHARVGGTVLKIKNLTKVFDAKTIVKNFTYEFVSGDSIGIIGKNGVGKTTFIKLLLGEIPADSGIITWGQTVTIGYFSQRLPQWGENETVLSLVEKYGLQFKWGGQILSVSAVLEQFLFGPKQQRSLVSGLSGGEKRRLALLIILIQYPNFLILDEPTNDFDIDTLHILENFLSSYTGCLLVITHDRYFMDRLVNHLFVMKGDGVIQDYWGTYSQYIEDSNLLDIFPAQTHKESDSPTESSHKNYYTMNEYLKQITKLTNQKDKLILSLNAEDIDYADYTRIGSEINELTTKINELEEKWFELAEG